MVPHCKACPVLATRVNAGGNPGRKRRSILWAHGGEKMDRRNWLRGLTALSLAGLGAAGWGQKPGQKGAVKGEDLQKNWKTLLAEGAGVAASPQPRNLQVTEGKN